MSVVIRTRKILVGISLLLLTVTGFIPASSLAPGAAKAAVVCVDLAITGFSVSPTQPVAGEPANIAITVTNQGTCDAQGFVVQFMQSQFGGAGPSGAVPGLAAGDTTTVDLTYTFPKAGNFLTVAQADPGNKIPETNKKNNLQILSVTVVPATVDLTISNFSLNPDEPVQGRVTTASITVTNLGNSAAGAFRVEWDPRPFVTPLSVQLNGLGAGASQTVTLNYTYLTPGPTPSYDVSTKAIVDPTNTVKETNENNNTASMTIQVFPPLPDLTVLGVTTSPNPVAGVPVTVSIDVGNVGVAPAGPFLVQWKPGPFIAPLTVQVNKLAASSSTVVNLSYTYARSGTYNSTVTVDPTNQVKELFENNNTAAFQVALSVPFIDLVALGLTSNPGSPTQGVPATITVTVQNQGNIAAGPFLVAWNPDTTGLIVPSAQTLSSQVNGLAAGATTTVTFSFSYPKFGDFRTLAQVDPLNAVKENNKTNNDVLLPLTVQPGDVDIDITSFSVNPNPALWLKSASATITVTNDGTYPAGNFAIQWKMASGDSGGPAAFLPGLLPGDSATVTLKGTYFSPGVFTTEAVVDPFNQLTEPVADGVDNISSFSITVKTH
ncbi:MAG TPA: CARDB domain-containing protein [Acidimicrobiales bacterium]|jgi:subtilase family serine protease|nr:CARDB domain-containing protein [Acidimicrobiales bacterium]